MFGRRAASLLFVAAALACAAGPVSAAPQASEAELRAAFVVNFLRFASWPDAPPGEALCLWRMDPFDGALARIASRVLPDAPVRIIDRPDQLGGCKLLYLPAEAPMEPALRQGLDGLPLLVVSARREDLGRGALIALYLRGERLRFSVDNSGARQRGVHLSAKMLGLAEEVR